MEQSLVILMNKTPYTGRMYRLFCVPSVGDADLWSKVTPFYSCNNENAYVEADCIRFDAEGLYTIEVTDGTYSGSITVEAVAEPVVSRTKEIVRVSNLAELRAACEQTYKELHIRPTATIEITDEPIYVGEGTIIDFDHQIFNYVIGADISESRLFEFYYDNSGIQNCWFNNLTDPARERVERQKIIDIENGDNVKIKNIVSQNQMGFGFGIGTIHYFPWSQVDTVSHKLTRWQATSLTDDPPVGGVEQGGIDPDGKLNDDTTCWRTADYILCPYCSNDAYIVGTHKHNSWPTSPAKYTNIAFYDADYSFLELQTGVQYWRRYKRPVGAAYWKAFVIQAEAPENRDTDSNCIFRMFGDTTGWHSDIYRGTEKGSQPAWVTNPVVDGYICLTNDSGFCSIAGGFNDLNISNVYIERNGRINLWGWDYEDGWYAMAGAVNTRVWSDAVVACSSVQGLTMRECKTNVYYSSHDPMQRTHLGCIFGNFYIRGCVGYQRLIDCYRSNTSWADSYSGVFESSAMTSEQRTSIEKQATAWKTSRLGAIKKKLVEAGSPITT